MTVINRADSAIGESNGPMLRQLQVVCNSSNRHGCFPMPIDTETESRLPALLTARTAFVDPGGLPTAARVLRERRRSRGGGHAFSAFLVEPPEGARTEPHGFGVAAVVLGMDAPPMADAFERAP